MLSNLIVTRQIDSRTHNSKRSEFRLDSRLYLSNLRLIDVGATVTSAGTVYYPFNTGVTALCENVLLYSGNTLIADCQELFRYTGYTFKLKDNATQLGVLPQLSGVLQGQYSRVTNRGNTWQKPYVLSRIRDTITNTVTSDVTGTIRLNEFIDFLNSTPYLAYIPNFRIVIEWADLTEVGRLSVADNSYVPTAYTILEPRLVIDEVVDPALLEKIPPKMNVNFLAVEHTRQRVTKPADTTTTNKEVFRPRTFEGKYLKDLLYFWTPDDNAYENYSGYGRNVAQAVYESEWNLLLNNAKFLQQNGIDSAARTILFNKISRGALASPLAGFLYDNARDSYMFLDVLAGGAGLEATQNNYLTVGVEDNVNGMEIDHRWKATGTEDTNTWSAYNVHMYGRVAKNMMLDGAQVQTVYV